MCTRKSAPSSFGHEADIWDSPGHFSPLRHIKFSRMQLGNFFRTTQPSNLGRPLLLPSTMSIIVSSSLALASCLRIVGQKCDSFCFATNASSEHGGEI